MNRSRLSIILGVGLILLAGPASAQSPTTKPKAPLDNGAGSNKSVAKAEADRIRKERQSQARSLLISLASDARSFRDQTLRARSLARIADTLWDIDAEQGRTLFRQAWEAAETADRESQKPFNLRRQVLTVAAGRDRLLGEEFLQKLKADQQETKAENSKPNLWELSEASEQRLSLAESLLRTGDIERALQFADPVLGSVTITTLDFLTHLREKDPAAADRHYAAMLTNTGGNMQADANTISLLSSYIFTPQIYVTFNTDGAPSWSMMPSPFPPANVGPQLRLAFFQTAAGVLLRPQPPQTRTRARRELPVSIWLSNACCRYLSNTRRKKSRKQCVANLRRSIPWSETKCVRRKMSGCKKGSVPRNRSRIRNSLCWIRSSVPRRQVNATNSTLNWPCSRSAKKN
jgi:hypothetical protein